MVAALVLLSGGTATAAALDVNPVRIDIAGADHPAELRITNTGQEELSVQIDARQWSQDQAGADQLFYTDLLLAVPPLFAVPAGEQQIVRIGFLGEPSADEEMSFRLLVTELAPPATEASGSALNMRLQLSIPVFVAPSSGGGLAEIVLSGIDRAPDGSSLTLRNVGNAHAKLHSIDLLDNRGWSPLTENGTVVRYLLPRRQAAFPIPGASRNIRAVRVTSADGKGWEHVVPPAR